MNVELKSSLRFAQSTVPDHDSEIFIEGVIDGFEVTAAKVARGLRDAKSERPIVRLNTVGGSIQEGVGIYNYLREVDATIVVMGWALSMGSYILQAGKRRVMAEGASLMVHAPWGVAYGDAKEIREEAETLEFLQAQMSRVYSRKSGQTEEEVAKWMEKDTWFDGKTALAVGLIDETDDEISAVMLGQDFARKHFTIPAQFGGLIKPKTTGRSMGLFGKQAKPEAEFALETIRALGFEAQLAEASKAGNPDWLLNEIKAEHEASCADLKNQHEIRIASFASAVKAAGVKIDESKLTPENVKEAVENTVSQRVAQLSAEQGLNTPIPQAPGTPGKQTDGLKGRARIQALMQKVAVEQGLEKA